ALGLPPLSHEDDAARGVQAALAMQAALRQLDMPNAIGVTTGLAFCGAIGSERRREYTMIGDVVNLSTRLMQAAPEDILCDAAAYAAAQARLAFDALPPIKVKGKAEPIAIFRPRHQAQNGGAAPLHAMRPHATLVGRSAERTALVEHVQAMLRGGRGDLVIIEGEAGIGNSRLLAELIATART